MTSRMSLTDRFTTDGRTLRGSALWTVRGLWAGLAVVGVIVAAAGFAEFLGGDRALLETQGPLSVQPDLARELEFRLFDLDLIKGAQTGMHLFGVVLFFSAAVLILWQRPRDWVVALSSATLLLAGVALFVPSKLLIPQSWDGWEPLVRTLGVFDAGPEFWRSLAGVTLFLFALLFPDGRFVPSWTRWMAVGVAVEVILWVALPGVAPFDVSEWPDPLKPIWTLGLALVAVYAQLHRYIRDSNPEARKQTRLVTISLTAVVGSFLLIWLLDPDLSRSVDLGLVLVTERTQAIYDLNVLSMLTVGVILFPVSIGVSVARYRLWDMDLIINRALVYGSMTAIIGVVLLAGVVIVGGVVENTFGQGIGVGISGLLMAVLFQPLRARVQGGIDRRFYPQKYDAERTLDALAERLRDEVDLEVVRTEIRTTVADTLQPSVTHLSLPSVDQSFDADRRLLADVYLPEANQPIEVGSGILPDEASAAFALRGVEVVVPLVSHNDLAGVLELGRRTDLTGYSALDLQLLRRLANQSAPVIRYAELVAREAEERAARQAYEQELRLAEKIQRDLLPRSLPELNGWELGARYEPARQVGGDLYDFIELPAGKLGIVIADVTDKGVPAAMVMATCRSVLRAAATGADDPSPGQVLARVNTLLLADIPDNMFVTCFYAILDAPSGRMSFANAGQNLPLMRSGDRVTELMARGMPLGLMAEMEYEEGEVVVSPGDGVLFYSDGLVEAHDQHGEMFGKARAIDRFQSHPGGAPLLDYLVESLIGFAGTDGAKDDDVTLVALKRLPRHTPEPPSLLSEFSVPSEPGGELAAIEQLDRVLGTLGLAERVAERLRTATAEATMNAMEHGNRYNPDLSVEVRVLASPTQIEVHVIDHGRDAPVTDAEEPSLEAKLAGDQSPRGWGLFLIKNMVDELRTGRSDGKNRIELVVKRDPES